ncbi:secreted RxLR effector protein 161-like [Juglans regia]|uniref:Secreted RxLR effector protein 161-like n=1 Tax=Juglans regia TaxID=51240 RepID=A0A6P9EP68_JUGRE|nr:secreted RxLR effector protein 161-like [Juglans regia]
MDQLKTISTPIGQHSKLSVTQAPETEEDKEFMQKIPYASMVGSIMYAMVCSRPHLTYAVSLVSRFMSNPRKPHWHAIKWVFQYLSGSRSLGVKFGKNVKRGSELEGFVDSDYVGNIDTRKSLTGFVFTTFGGAISWKANLQPVVALSTTEAEYIAMTEAIKEAIWLKGISHELGMYEGNITVHCDNQSTIHLAKNQREKEPWYETDVRILLRDVETRRLETLHWGQAIGEAICQITEVVRN